LDNRAIWYKGIVRDELVNLIDRDLNAPIQASRGKDFSDIPLSSAVPIAYWQEDPQRRPTLPTGVIVHSEELEDFIAWVATYVPIRPFTAYCRVLEARVIQYFSDAHPVSFIPLENCFLGIILAESARDVAAVDGTYQLSPIGSAGTLSFSLTRAVALGMDVGAADWIERQWKRARALIPDQKKSNDTSLVSRVFRLICALDNPGLSSEEDQIILGCAHDIADTGEIQQDNWFRLTKWSPQLSRSSEIKRLPREARIQLLRRVAESLMGEMDPRAPFVIGYLGSAVAPGPSTTTEPFWNSSQSLRVRCCGTGFVRVSIGGVISNFFRKVWEDESQES
jgi:hypothetical protein